MRHFVVLKTRCGCQRFMEVPWDFVQQCVHIPLMPDIRAVYSSDPVAYLTVDTRTFEYYDREVMNEVFYHHYREKA